MATITACSTTPFGKITTHLGRQVSALDHAHRQRIANRDVKSANVVLDTAGNAYLIDFSIACIPQRTTTLTHTGTIIGMT